MTLTMTKPEKGSGRKRGRPSKQPAQQPVEGTSPKPARPKREGKALNLWLDETIAEAMEAYIASTDPKVSQTATVESALRLFLQGKGFWPWPPPSTPS